MSAENRPVIHWFRRDLRVADNRALASAAGGEWPVIAVYFVSGWRGSHTWTGPKRQHFLCGCLESLSRIIEELGGHLVIREGDAVDGLRGLIRESGAVAVHFNADPDPFGKAVEARVRGMCASIDVECHAHADAWLHGADEVLTQVGQPYRVYTPYSRTWLGLEKPPPVAKPRVLRTPAGLKSLPLPTVEHWGWEVPQVRIVEPGERAARDRLKRAVSGIIQAYAQKRDFPAEDGTSRIPKTCASVCFRSARCMWR